MLVTTTWIGFLAGGLPARPVPGPRPAVNLQHQPRHLPPHHRCCITTPSCLLGCIWTRWQHEL